MIITYLVPFGISVIESLCIFIFFDTFFEWKIGKYKRVGLILESLLLAGIMTTLGIWLPSRDEFSYSILRFIVSSSIYFCFLLALYRGKLQRKIAAAIATYLLLTIVDFFGYLIADALGFGNIINGDSVVNIILLILSFKLLLFLVVALIRFGCHRFYKVGNLDAPLSMRRWLTILMMPLLSIISIWALFSLASLENQTNPILLLVSFGWGFMCIVVYYLVMSAASSEQQLREKAVIEEMVRNSLEYATNDVKTQEYLRSAVHDFYHHIDYISTLLTEQENSQALNYIQEIKSTVYDHIQRVDTNARIVNAILNQKMALARAKGIGFDIQINDLGALPFADDDVVVILSNLLDNAIEACDKIMSGKYIHFKFVVIPEKEIVLSIHNTHDGKIGKIITQGSHLLSTKDNREMHGIGLSSVIKRIEKYSGEYAVSHNKTKFQFTAIIPLPALVESIHS